MAWGLAAQSAGEESPGQAPGGRFRPQASFEGIQSSVHAFGDVPRRYL